MLRAIDRHELRVIGSEPSTEELLDVLVDAGRLLGKTVCWYFAGNYHFALGEGWSIALSADSAGRITVERCLRCRAVSKMWVSAGDRARLALVIERMSNETAELV